MVESKKLLKRLKGLEAEIEKRKQKEIVDKNRVLCFFAFLASFDLAVANFFLIIRAWNLLGLGSLAEESVTSFYQLLILYPLVGEYVFVGLSAICLAALFKGGFDKLKRFDEEGLLAGLAVGLAVGLVFGLVGLAIGLAVGLVFGLIGSVMFGLIFGLIIGLIIGLIFGLIRGLLFGLIAGLEQELK